MTIWHSEGEKKTVWFSRPWPRSIGWMIDSYTPQNSSQERAQHPSGRRLTKVNNLTPPCLRLQVFMKLHGICRNRIQWSIIIYIFNHLWHYAEFSDTDRSLASHTLAFTSIYSRLYNQVLKCVKSMTIHQNPSLVSSRGHSSGQSLEGSCQGYGKISAVEVETVF